jgi:hypothetical protein
MAGDVGGVGGLLVVDFFFGGGFVLLQRGRRRNRKGECQWLIHILTITDGFTDKMVLSVNPLASLSVKVTRHCMTFPV